MSIGIIQLSAIAGEERNIDDDCQPTPSLKGLFDELGRSLRGRDYTGGRKRGHRRRGDALGRC
jgi:hypothetical protein